MPHELGRCSIHPRSDNKQTQETTNPHTITIPIANAVSCYARKVRPHNSGNQKRTNERTSGFPYFPVCSTSPRPRRATHALSIPFGSAYIVNSPRRCFASTNNDKPVTIPPIQCAGRDRTAASSQSGTTARRAAKARYAFCIPQNQP